MKPSEYINWDYIKQLKDPYNFLKTYLAFKPKDLKKNNRVLIVDPCLIGDFTAALPALSTFIKNNPSLRVDLMVTSPLKRLAERIRGVRKVFVSKSSTFRSIEKYSRNLKNFNNYDEIIVMRISDESYSHIKNINAGRITTPLKKYLKYMIYSIKDASSKKQPIQRREIDFDLLNQKFREVKFEDIFDFNKKDYDAIRKIDVMKTKENIIVIHTGPVWVMRKWDNKKWAELIKKINKIGKFRFIFVGTDYAEKDYQEISQMSDFKVYSLINKIDIKNLMLVLRQSSYLIGVDSGPRNMAHLADLRSITLFGSAASGAIYMPWDKKDIVIDKSNGGGLHQAFFYTKKNFMEEISVDDVFRAFKRLIKTK